MVTNLAFAEQQIVDRLLDLEDVDVDQQLWIFLAHVGLMARGTMTLAMLGTEPIFNSEIAPLSSRRMTN